MKICYDTLEYIKLTPSGDFAGKGGYYIEIYSCLVCGQSFLSKKGAISSFCSKDPDNGLACCVKCHYKYGHEDECSTWSIAQRRCE